jgi:hypothetical protein
MDRHPLTINMMKMRLKATSHKALIDRQAAQVAEADWVAREILVGMEAGVNMKKSKQSKLN